VELKIKQNVRTNYFEPRVMAAFELSDAPGARPAKQPRPDAHEAVSGRVLAGQVGAGAGGANIPYRISGDA
jgi:hypothetical protein